MNEILRARHDADMSVPEHEIAAGERVRAVPVELLADFVRLHIGVARAGKPGSFARELHQS